MRVISSGPSIVPDKLPEHLRLPVVYLDDPDGPLTIRQYDAYRSFVDYYREMNAWVKTHSAVIETDRLLQALGTDLPTFFRSVE